MPDWGKIMERPPRDVTGMDDEENVRAKLRLLRTAHKRVHDALERDGAYTEEIFAALLAIEAAAHLMEKLLEALRDLGN